MNAVHQIVRGHDRANPGPHGGAKRRFIDFLEGALVHVGADRCAVDLLIVAHKMFGRGDDALALDAWNFRRRHRP